MDMLGNNKRFNIYVTGVPVGDNKECGAKNKTPKTLNK